MTSTTTQLWNFYNPVHVHFGAGSRSALIPILSGQRVLVVSTKRGRTQFINDPQLGALQADLTWVDSVTTNPGVAETQAEIDRLSGQNFDAVLAFGGGSAIDAAKAVTAALTPTVECRDLAQLIASPAKYLNQPLLPLHVATTTSGTGAEVTPFATIWDHPRRKKLSLASPRLFPVTAVADPELTYEMPPAATLSTSLDALNQAFESVWNRNSTPLTTLMAARAIRLGLSAIPRLQAAPDDRLARIMMAESSLLAGLCISQTRTAICHSISYPLTAHFGLSHGLACAASMTAVAKQVLSHAPQVLNEIAFHIGLSDSETLISTLEAATASTQLRQLVRAAIPTADSVLTLRSEMITPERSDNFIMPVGPDILESILRASLD
jgi:phosphonate metabolism-associated iron-containing alcohol dehydrogenase